MWIRSTQGLVELQVVERAGAGTPSPGDVRLRVKLAGWGMSNVSHAWVEADALDAFVQGLRALRSGAATEAMLRSMSPGELELRIWRTDASGHMAVEVRTERRSTVGGRVATVSATALSLEVDPDQLVLIRERAEALPTSAAGPPRDDPGFVAPLLHRGLVHLRSLCNDGEASEAAELADRMHNLPLVLSTTHWPEDDASYRLELEHLSEHRLGAECITYAEQRARGKIPGKPRG